MKCVLLLALVPLALAGHASVHIKGKLICPSDPSKASGVKVKLLDKKFGPDDNMGEATSNSNGEFDVSGTAKNLVGDGDVRFRIYHDCLNRWPGYQRKLDFEVPDVWKNQGMVNFGTFNLETIVDESEEKDLIH